MNNQPAWVLRKHRELDMIGNYNSIHQRSRNGLTVSKSAKNDSVPKREFLSSPKKQKPLHFPSPTHRPPAQMPDAPLHAPTAILDGD